MSNIKTRQYKCTLCKQFGHNKRTCILNKKYKQPPGYLILRNKERNYQEMKRNKNYLIQQNNLYYNVNIIKINQYLYDEMDLLFGFFIIVTLKLLLHF